MKVLFSMKWLFYYAVTLLAAATSRPLQAPAALPETTAYQAVVVYAGPGDTYKQLSRLNLGLPITIVERNHSGMWVHIARKTEDGSVVQEGWVISAFLNRDESLRSTPSGNNWLTRSPC